jgi:hypothetical protein
MVVCSVLIKFLLNTVLDLKGENGLVNRVRAGGVVQVVQLLPSKGQALCSNSSTV